MDSLTPATARQFARSRPRRHLPLLGVGLLVTQLAAAQGFDPLASGGSDQGRGERRGPPIVTAIAVAETVRGNAGASLTFNVELEVQPGWHVQSNKPTYDYLIPTVVTVDLPSGWPAARMTYPPDQTYHPTFSPDPLAVYEGLVAIAVEIDVPAATPTGRVVVPLELRTQACDDRSCLQPTDHTATVHLEITGTAPEPGTATAAVDAPAGATSGAASAEGSAASTSTTKTPRSLAAFLLLAVFGGLILNLMPCVLPILSLKVFGLVQSAAQGRRATTTGALATAAGILVSFWALAAAAVGARAAGAAVGWGVQFQEPRFVAFLAVVIVLFSLNLWGLFEIPLPSRLATWAGGRGHDGIGGHFASGLFATLMATPCSAPYLGTAMGFALGQPALTVVAVFTAVGVGMALPYLALAAWPGAAKALPRPGAWMDVLKGIMGFLLAGSLAWLFYVLAGQISRERLAATQLLVLVLGLGIWLRSRLTTSPGRAVGMVIAIAGALGTIVVAAAPSGRSADSTGSSTATTAVVKLIPWVPFDRDAAEELAAEGRLVFVDVTADWCFTCKVNERLVIETPEIAAAFAERGVIAMQADWTNRDAAIGEFLADHGRYGIPFYLLYRPGAQPLVLPELLTKQILLDALSS